VLELAGFDGFGVVPPYGHATHMRVFIDPDLLQYDEVWAAAGTWHDVFGIEPNTPVEASEGPVTDLKRGCDDSGSVVGQGQESVDEVLCC
jgi:prolyl-tRNA editing enzyme YbaK/EbsC (Cys-tRNA(Pro) deacylase)